MGRGQVLTDAERDQYFIERVQGWQPQVGWFVSLQDWFDDAWAEIVAVEETALSFAWWHDGQLQTRRESFAVIKAVAAVLPGDVHHVHLVEGLYGAHQAANLETLPDRIQQAPVVEKKLDFLASMKAKRIREMKTADPQPGDFVNLDTWFGDVWAEVKDVFHSGSHPSLTIYYQRDHKTTEYTFFDYIGKVRKYLPADARIVHFQEGKWGDKDGTLQAVPSRVKRGERDYTPKPVPPVVPVKQPRNRYLKPEQVEFQVTHSATLTTTAFDGLRSETAEIIAFRVLSLPFVKSVDYLHGCIEIELTDPSGLPALLAELKRHLTTKPAKGERVTEHYNAHTDTTFGASPYSHRYDPGTYGI